MHSPTLLPAAKSARQRRKYAANGFEHGSSGLRRDVSRRQDLVEAELSAQGEHRTTRHITRAVCRTSWRPFAYSAQARRLASIIVGALRERAA